MKEKTTGVLAILGASLMWALEPICAKLAYRSADFLQTSMVRAWVIIAVALVYIMAGNRRKRRRGSLVIAAAGNPVRANMSANDDYVPVNSPAAEGCRGKLSWLPMKTALAGLGVSGRQLVVLGYIALAGTVFADMLYLYALAKIPVLNAVLIAHMQPIFIIFIGFFILKEDRLVLYDYLGIALMIAAGLLVTSRNWANLRAIHLGEFADALVLLATIAWASTAVVMRKYLQELNAGVLTFYRYTLASVALGVLMVLFSGLPTVNIYQFLVGLVVGVGTILYYEALKRLKAAQVSALELTAPFFAAIFGMFIGEVPTLMQMAGIMLLIVGVLLLSRKEEVYLCGTNNR